MKRNGTDKGEWKKTARKIRRFNEKLVYDLKFAYVRTGHIKNEFLGFLTVFNAKRSRLVRTERHVRYDEENERLYLNIYYRRDRKPSEKAPVFVYIHGGGWIGGLPETREAFNTKIAEAGYFVVSLYYGHSPYYPHPEPIQNIYKAFAWLKRNASKYNIDAEEIFVGGESAGAHLSAMAGAISSNPSYNALFDLPDESRHQKIAGLVLNCGVFDLRKALGINFRNIRLYVQSYCGGVPLDEVSEEKWKEISPVHYVTADFPPCFLVSAERDALAPLTFDLAERLKTLGVEYAHYHGKGRAAVHAFAVVQILKISSALHKSKIKPVFCHQTLICRFCRTIIKRALRRVFYSSIRSGIFRAPRSDTARREPPRESAKSGKFLSSRSA